MKTKQIKIKAPLKTKDLKAKLQTLVNKFIRLRDTVNGVGYCISCGRQITFQEMQAGHYYSKGAYPAVRFDEININGQCAGCNTWKSGNLAEYRLGLIQKYGENVVNELDLRRKTNLSGNQLKDYLIKQISCYENLLKGRL